MDSSMGAAICRCCQLAALSPVHIAPKRCEPGSIDTKQHCVTATHKHTHSSACSPAQKERVSTKGRSAGALAGERLVRPSAVAICM
jgi:hypothetical protein